MGPFTGVRISCLAASSVVAALISTYAAAGPMPGAVEVAAGGFHSCALFPSGAIKCWGFGGFGQLGNGIAADAVAPTDVVGLPAAAVAVTAGGAQTCALTSTGGVFCWGDNSAGAAGDGTFQSRLTPVGVAGFSSGVASISSRAGHVCAVKDGGAWCWGLNQWGQLGDSTFVNRTAPTVVSGLGTGVMSVAAGGAHSCALTTGGGVKCWGSNSGGQLGDGTTLERLESVNVVGLSSGVRAIAAGYTHNCALMDAGGVKCWGAVQSGSLGGGTTASSAVPVDVTGLSGVAALSAGYDFSCALTTGGAVKCWGANTFGQIGDGTGGTGPSAPPRVSPVDVVGLSSGALSIASGQGHSCAALSNGQTRCWGGNGFGAIGNAGVGFYAVVPAVVGTFTAQSIAFGSTPNRAMGDAPFTINATASSGLPVTLSSLDTSVCTVSGTTVTLVAMGICRIAANQGGDLNFAAAPQAVRAFLVTAGADPGAPRLVNLSTRGVVGPGEGALIGGFVIGGASPKTVVVRARGPSLAAFGIARPLTDPQLHLVRPDGTGYLSNQDWNSGPYAATVQAIGFAPSDAREAAIVATLAPGAYTAVVSSQGASTGTAIVEVFELDKPELPLINTSTRGSVLTGDDVMIGGFVITGSGPQTVVVRARGPSLIPFGIANALANPSLQLVRSADFATVAVNDDWGSAPNAAAITASGFAPSDSLEAAILVTLDPGAYTAIVSGASGGTGIGIVEVFAQ